MKIKGKQVKDFISSTMIGLGYGLVKTQDLILNKSLGITTQDAMDALSNWIGRELMKQLLNKKLVKATDSNEKIMDALTSVIDIAEELDVDIKDNEIKIIVQQCRICPKRVGGYDLEGNTACPVGGLITGAMNYVRGKTTLVTRANLQTGEICHIDLSI